MGPLLRVGGSACGPPGSGASPSAAQGPSPPHPLLKPPSTPAAPAPAGLPGGPSAPAPPPEWPPVPLCCPHGGAGTPEPPPAAGTVRSDPLLRRRVNGIPLRQGHEAPASRPWERRPGQWRARSRPFWRWARGSRARLPGGTALALPHLWAGSRAASTGELQPTHDHGRLSLARGQGRRSPPVPAFRSVAVGDAAPSKPPSACRLGLLRVPGPASASQELGCE